MPNIILSRLAIEAPTESIFGSFATVESSFIDGSVHLVQDGDPTTVVEPVNFGNYHKQGEAAYESDENQWILRVKNGKWPEYDNAGDLLAPFIIRGTVIIPIPSSTAGKVNGISKAIQHMAKSHGMVDGSGFLIRHTTIPQQHKSSERRSQARHLESLEVELPERFYSSRILLLDDIFTSGTTMSACLHLLMSAGAENVTCACLARTV